MASIANIKVTITKFQLNGLLVTSPKIGTKMAERIDPKDTYLVIITTNRKNIRDIIAIGQ